MTDVQASYMGGDTQIPPGAPLRETQVKIHEKIISVLGYEITNHYLRDFLDEFGDPYQLRCEPSESTKHLHNTQLQHWEELFTDSFYRAARIAARRQQTEHPHFRGINMEKIVAEAEEIIETENATRESASEDIGYHR